MPSVMPSQVVQTIDELFPHAAQGRGDGQLQASHSPQLIGIMNLIKTIPPELITVPPPVYADRSSYKYDQVTFGCMDIERSRRRTRQRQRQRCSDAHSQGAGTVPRRISSSARDRSSVCKGRRAAR
jgi:hypothetical protein